MKDKYYLLKTKEDRFFTDDPKDTFESKKGYMFGANHAKYIDEKENYKIEVIGYYHGNLEWSNQNITHDKKEIEELRMLCTSLVNLINNKESELQELK